MIELLNREKLILLNKKLKYPLAIAEKDYFLALISKIIFNSKIKDKLIFKGGTALHHIYLPQLRFSEDLDFSSNASKIELDEVKNIFVDYDFLKVKKKYVSDATIKIEKLQYTGLLNQPNSLKIEIDFLQNVVLPPLELDYKNVYGVKTKVRVMDIKEITAEKIRAMNDRIRYRDFYDFAMIMKKLNVNTTEVISLIKQKEIRKIISKINILENWRLARQEKQQEFSSIFYFEEVADEEVEKWLKKLDFIEIK
ncbi:nucleotidyl transferase AbiEii/AbiGii toxin family protein [Candidatus Kuenenbacteria bacterium]|nr:nucleotidyl transferase AbiEii/AbiGii toxin family protein [Candidatus Kuenenbacteria bacterium]